MMRGNTAAVLNGLANEISLSWILLINDTTSGIIRVDENYQNQIYSLNHPITFYFIMLISQHYFCRRMLFAI